MKNNKKHDKDASITSQPWYKEFTAFVELRNLRPRTRKTYLSWVRRLAKHYDRASLLRLGETKVRDFLLYHKVERELKDSTINQALCALRCFYRDHLGREWQCWKDIKFHREEQLPNIISRERMATLLGSIRAGHFRALFTVMHHCGLRLSECTHLKPGHIDGKRRVVRVVNGKGGKSREVPISEELLVRLRRYWKAHRNPEWLFPGVEPAALQSRRSDGQGEESYQQLRGAGCPEGHCGIAGVAGQGRTQAHHVSHSAPLLRHLHAREAGVSIRLVSQYLGHRSLKPTLTYLHLTEVSECKAREVLSGFPGL